MAFWNVDLTTEDGADNAAQIGGFACFIEAVLGALGIALASGALAYDSMSATAIGVVSIGLGEILIFVVAGFRLRAGRGVIWGSVAALVILAEIVMRLVTLTGIFAILINVILLIGIVNGVRGARALTRRNLSTDDAAEIFN